MARRLDRFIKDELTNVALLKDLLSEAGYRGVK
jgi:hypothetical protein